MLGLRMLGERQCNLETCKEKSNLYGILGKFYCREHYGVVLKKEFLEEYKRWEGNRFPPINS